MSTITVNEAATMLSVSSMTVRRLIASGKLPAWRVGGDGPIRIESEDVEALRVPVTMSCGPSARSVKGETS